MIQSHGVSSAQFMLIGDGGSTEDFNKNYAIIGAQEITLNQVCGLNIRIGDSWRSLLIKDKVDLQDFNSYKDRQTQQYDELLIEEIRQVNPYLLIPLGELSFRFLTGLEGIRKFRGSVLLTHPKLKLPRPIKVLPILGPNPYINQEPIQRYVSQIDFSKAHNYFNDDPPPENNLNIWIATTAESLRSFLRRSYTDDGLLVFDIETFMGIPTCISFCFDGKESVCIPLLDRIIDFDQRLLMLGLVSKVLASPIAKVNQNIKYDWHCLEHYNFVVNNVVGDTQLGASCITPEFPKNLGFLNSIYTEIPYFKDEGKEFDPAKHNREQFFLYNAKDSLSTWRIHAKQQEEIDEIGSRYVYDNLCGLLSVYKNMENNGIRYDDERRLQLVAKYESLYNIQQIKLDTLAGKHINANSPPQVAKLVYGELGFSYSKHAKDTGEDSLDNLYVFGTARHNPTMGKIALKCIIALRKIKKVLEYLDTVPFPDGRWRCSYRLDGAKTGRTTASHTTDTLLAWEEKKTIRKIVEVSLGRSFQTIGKHGFKIDDETYGQDLRDIFVPSRGYCFVENDLSQAEARIDAVLAGNFDMLAVFDGPVGIHRLTGSWVFDCKPEDIKKNIIVTDANGISVDRYHMSKTVRHAGERNMFPDRLVLMTQLPYRECEIILKKFHDNQPEIREVFHREIKEAIDRDRTLIAPNGRFRQFLGRKDHKLYNDAISQLPQAIVGDQLKFSLKQTMAECGEFANLLNEQHDGALAEVKIGREYDYIASFKKNVETGIDFRRNCTLYRDIVLTIPSEASISKTTWYRMEDVK